MAKTFDYVPKDLVDDQGNKYKSPIVGKVKVEVLLYKERMTMAKNFNFNDKATTADQIDLGIKMIDLVAKQTQSVDLEIKSSGEKITSLDELGYYKEGADIINDIGQTLIKGVQLGN